MWNFVKWQGLGNDFVLVRADAVTPEEGAELAQRWCRPHWGVGADGLIFLLPGREGAAITMEIFNADGTVAAMCGNGIRCLAAWAVQEGWVDSTSFSVATRAGLRIVEVIREELGAPQDWLVDVDMGFPEVRERAEVVLRSGAVRPSYVVSMGNLHRAVLLNGSLSPEADGAGELNALDIEAEARTLEASPFGLCNVEFVRWIAAEKLAVRVREQGVGETLACGTGACAAVVAATVHGWCSGQAEVSLPGGTLAVRYADDGHILMRGPAQEVFRGSLA